MVFNEINYLAVLVATVASMILGMLWYGPLFMKAWMKEMKLTARDIKKQKKENGMAKPMISMFIMSFVTASVLSAFLIYRGDTSVMAGLTVAFLAWLGFTATVHMSKIIFEKSSFKFFMINAGFDLVMLLAMGAIIAAWP